MSTCTSRPCTRRVSDSPRAWSRPSNRTQSGPPGPRSSTTRVRPGTTPRSSRCASAAASQSCTRSTRNSPPTAASASLVPQPSTWASPDRGIGSPCGSCVGRSSMASMRSSSRSDTACSRASASSCTSCGREPDDADEEGLEQPVPADDVPGVPGAVRRQRGAVVRALDEPVLGEPLEHDRHGGRGDAQVPGQDRRAHLVAATRQHEDGPQRVFGRGGGHEPAAGS